MKGYENLYAKCVQQPWKYLNIFFMKAAVSENISCFLKELAPASERYQEKCATASDKKICTAASEDIYCFSANV